MEEIRIHKGEMETRYGTDFAIVFDDPVCPKYTEEDAIRELKSELNFTDADDNDDSEYDGYWDGSVGAYFDYKGFFDVQIPESIVERIRLEGR